MAVGTMANFVQSSILNMAGFTKKDAPSESKKRRLSSSGELSSGPSGTQARSYKVKLSRDEIEANRVERAKQDWNPAWTSIYNWAFFDDKEDVGYVIKLTIGSVVGAAAIKYGSVLLPSITRPNLVEALLIMGLPVIVAVVWLAVASFKQREQT